jgi:hypothetical protein
MVPNLPLSCLRSEDDIRGLRWMVGWQSLGFNAWVRCGTFPLIDLQPREFIFFTCYAVAGLVLPVSTFLFMLLEFYELQL